VSAVTRRDALKLIVAAGTAAGCSEPTRASSLGTKKAKVAATATATAAGPDVVVDTLALSTPWQTRDPFLFCMHHDDHYPAGDERLGPAAALTGRNMGSDFSSKDGWSMYHGRVVPGFPRHPHRGFETVTIVRSGLLDHSDSLGAAARYGHGDVQWLTAGGGILHAEMFPLLERASENPVELFQIWLNLPARNKMVDPYFTMLWANRIPTVRERDGAGREIAITLNAGTYASKAPPPPPPNSWAAEKDSDLAIWTIKLAPGATWTLPPARRGTARSLYFFRGREVTIGGRRILPSHRVDLTADVPAPLVAGPDETELLLLQARPIGEPIVKHGPFVMNSREEIQKAYQDYRTTQFGGWPWSGDDPVHGREPDRFARHADGRTERPA
jgi:redox-sensitive bicupin YhaK (pirin superfamily)